MSDYVLPDWCAVRNKIQSVKYKTIYTIIEIDLNARYQIKFKRPKGFATSQEIENGCYQPYIFCKYCGI